MCWCFSMGRYAEGQPCGYTPEQIEQFVCDPRMSELPHIADHKDEHLWHLRDYM